VVFGASGRTGQEFVSQALGRGHAVWAFAPTPVKIRVQDPAAAQRAIEGRDAALSVLGPTRNLPDRLVTRGTRHIIKAMQSRDVRRLVVTAGAGVAGPRVWECTLEDCAGFSA